MHGAIILAGGRSSRMGSEKGLVELCGKPMVMHVADAVRPLVGELIVVANHPGYAALGLRAVPDDHGAIGPVGGLATGLRHAAAEACFVLGCDVPLVGTALLHGLQQQLGQAGAVAVTHAGRRHPLVSLFRRDALPVVLGQVAAGRLRFEAAILAVGGFFWDPVDWPGFDPACLRNFNTMAEVEGHDCDGRA